MATAMKKLMQNKGKLILSDWRAGGSWYYREILESRKVAWLTGDIFCQDFRLSLGMIRKQTESKWRTGMVASVPNSIKWQRAWTGSGSKKSPWKTEETGVSKSFEYRGMPVVMDRIWRVGKAGRWCRYWGLHSKPEIVGGNDKGCLTEETGMGLGDYSMQGSHMCTRNIHHKDTGYPPISITKY